MTRRILVKGACGAGKSTLARELGSRLDLPVVELDALYHGPNWTEAPAEELRARVTAILDDERGWVVDGNYDSKLGKLLWDRAELIVWLDLPLRTKLGRLLRRTAGRVLRRKVLWNGNRETLKHAFWGGDALFPWAVKTHFRHRKNWPTRLAARGRPHVRLRSESEVQAWLSAFCASAS